VMARRASPISEIRRVRFRIMGYTEGDSIVKTETEFQSFPIDRKMISL
jgi:hypothetical protein